jgi:RNA polymerase sigma factor (sigma-70 family)
MSTYSVPDLTRSDERAWRALVAEHGPKIWAVARSFRLNDADAADVFQTTLLNLAEHLDELREPDRISAWLVTTAKHESIRVLTLRRPLPVRWRPEVVEDGPEHQVLTESRDKELWRAFRTLSPRCQQLLRLFAYLPEYTYAQLAKAMGIGVESVGQTKTRCLRTLRMKLGDVR